MPRSSKPLVSIILPTYNRASFLSEAFEAIKKQSFEDWELIVVDDGSTDNTEEVVKNFALCVSQEIHYIYQDNQGPAAARNKGLNYAQGIYIAFYDSDDIWLPDYLDACVRVLEDYEDIDWVFTACKLIELEKGEVVNANHFFEPNGLPRMLLTLKTEQRNNLYVIKNNEEAVCCALREGLRAGLQNSVIRAGVFEQCRLNPLYRIGEDQILVIEALKFGYRFAFLKSVHVIYRMHQDNLSSANIVKCFEERLEIYLNFIEAISSLRQQLNLKELFFLHQRISSIYFWNIAYRLYEFGDLRRSNFYLRRALSYFPLSFSYWKYFFLINLRNVNKVVFK